VFHTAADPPRIGRTSLAIIGSRMNTSAALTNTVSTNSHAAERRPGGATVSDMVDDSPLIP